MKKALLFISLFTIVLSFSSCGSDNEETDTAIKESIIGTWEGTSAFVDGVWIDLTKYPYSSRFGFSATFYSDGTYYGQGAFGTGGGTYKINGKTIETYVDNRLYLKYQIKVMTNTVAELTIIEGNSTLDVKVKKVK